MGCVGRIVCRTAPVDDLTVFAIFVAVRPPLQHRNLCLSEWITQNRYFPIGYHVWWLYSE